MALGKRKSRPGKMTVGRADATTMEAGTGRRARGWIENAFRMGVSRPVHLLTERLQSIVVDKGGSLLLPEMMINTAGILPLMLRKDEMEAMGGGGLKVRVLDADGLEYAMYLKKKNIHHNSSCCELVGPQCRAFINKKLIIQRRRRNNIVWAFRANTPGWRYRSPDEDPLWFARDLCLAITVTTQVVDADEDAASVVAKGPPPMDGWRGVRPNPRRSSRRRRTCSTAAPRSWLLHPLLASAASGCIDGAERHWVLDSSHGRGPLVLRFIRPATKPIV